MLLILPSKVMKHNRYSFIDQEFLQLINFFPLNFWKKHGDNCKLVFTYGDIVQGRNQWKKELLKYLLNWSERYKEPFGGGVKKQQVQDFCSTFAKDHKTVLFNPLDEKRKNRLINKLKSVSTNKTIPINDIFYFENEPISQIQIKEPAPLAVDEQGDPNPSDNNRPSNNYHFGRNLLGIFIVGMGIAAIGISYLKSKKRASRRQETERKYQ